LVGSARQIQFHHVGDGDGMVVAREQVDRIACPNFTLPKDCQVEAIPPTGVEAFGQVRPAESNI
jgi:hypothetical protein